MMMMGNARILLCAVLFVYCVGLHVTNATICKPLSKFKIDCNTCFCSRDGARYACTRKACRGEPVDFQFINDEGYDDNDDDEDGQKEVVIPFINDEIPPSREEWIDDQPNDDYAVPVRNEIDDPRFDKAIQDVDTDDQEVEDMNEYRFKNDLYM